MGLLHKETFICVDCESTGLDPKTDRIIEVGAVRFTLDQQLDTYQQLINPGCPIPPESTVIHHITDEMVADQPMIEQELPKILEFLKTGLIIGHGVQFDLELLNSAAKRAKIPCTLLSRPHIDTLRLARHYGQSPNNALETLREHFGITAETAHRAYDDAVINMKVFRRLVEPFRTTEKIFDALAKPVRLKRMPLGKHKGRPFKEIPIEYLKWASRQDFDRDLLYSIRSEIKQRGTHGFRQSANPFQGL